MIVNNCLREAARGKARRVLFAFGADHKYGIEDFLYRFHGIKAEPVVRRFLPANRPVAPEVVMRWKRIRDHLADGLRKGTIPPPSEERLPDGADPREARGDHPVQGHGQVEDARPGPVVGMAMP